MRITLFDYGAGNLHSLEKALTVPGVDVHIEEDPGRALETDVLVLPGVGAFSAAARRLAPGRERMRDAIASGLPCLGICLGMQLFFEGSEEGPGEGLGLLPGQVTRLRATRVPHMGWNSVETLSDELPHTAYFAHSFVCRNQAMDSVIGWTSHEGDRFPSAVRHGSALGVQFHPEKSSEAGVRFLHAFVKGVRR